MSENSTPLTVALDVREDLQEYLRTKDRSALVNALKDQFLAQRHLSASKTEEARHLAASVLLMKIPQMSDSMLLRTLETLSRVGDVDMQSLLGALPGSRAPLFALNQTFAGPPGGHPSLSGPCENPGENPVRSVGNILEALEHISTYLSKKREENSQTIDADAEDVDD